MTGDAVSIVEEFFGSTDPQVRMNAMTAYGVIGNKQSIDALVQVALEADLDDTLRQRAEQELATLTDTKAQILIEKLQEILNVPEKKASLPTGRLIHFRSRKADRLVALENLSGLKVHQQVPGIQRP